MGLRKALRRWLEPPPRPLAPPSAETRRLHWGCGTVIAEGWINTDVQKMPGVDLVTDARAGLPFPDGSIHCIASQHVLVELTIRELVPALQELRRVLRPGGVLRMGLPDLERALEAYARRDTSYFHLIPDKAARVLSGKLMCLLLWHGHSRTPLTYEWMEELMLRAGFREVVRCEYGVTRSSFPELATLDGRPRESFFVEATK
jgi:SAM-dependent methyltransferase